MKTAIRLACVLFVSSFLTGCQTNTTTDTSYLTRRFKRACDTCKCIDFNPTVSDVHICKVCGHHQGTHTRLAE